MQPSGIFVTPPKINSASDALDVSYFQASNMNGVALRVQWYALEPSQGVYNWTLIDDMVSNAVTYNKAISIVIVGASQSPDWVKAISAPLTFDIMSPTLKEVVLPTPWNTNYLQSYLDIHTALHTYLASKSALTKLALVKLALFSSDSAELNLPRAEDLDINALDVWQAANYTSTKITQAYSNTAASIHSIFPGVKLGQVLMDGRSFPRLDDHGNLINPGGVDTADQIISGMINSLGSNWVAIGNGLCHNIAARPMSDRVEYARTHGATTGWQTTHSGSGDALCASCADDDRTNATKCTRKRYKKAFSNALDAGATYFEVWPADFDEFIDSRRWL